MSEVIVHIVPGSAFTRAVAPEWTERTAALAATAAA
jgi:hypothetical protein